MDDIKSAREIALAKVEKIGEATAEERLKWKYVPKGEELAAKYLKGDINLANEFSKFEDTARPYVIQGASSVLVRNLGLPRTEAARRVNKLVMDGLKTIKKDKVAVENVYSRLRYLFKHYAEQGEQQRAQAYESLKADFTAKLQQAMQQQMGAAGMLPKINVETQPQFQQEWRRVQSQLDAQYTKFLEECRQQLLTIP